MQSCQVLATAATFLFETVMSLGSNDAEMGPLNTLRLITASIGKKLNLQKIITNLTLEADIETKTCFLTFEKNMS